jgi:tRNA threonylcarbamoyladenosine biosynthesis protein TsaB
MAASGSFGEQAVKILALETTERIGSVAAMSDGKLLLELKLDSKQRSAQSLAPGMKALLEKVAWQPNDVDLVATPIGPGSFTGLRVGVATAKSFAYSVQADILGVDTLEVIAARAPHDVPAIWVAVDAQRGQVVAGAFQREADGWLRPTGPARLVDIDAWLDALPTGTLVTGPILRKIVDRVPEHATPLDPEYWPPTAAAVAQVASRLCAAGHRDDVFRLVPRYSRQSAAEEKDEG